MQPRFKQPQNILVVPAFSVMAAMLLASPARSQNSPVRQIEPGISFYEATQPTAVKTRTALWVYLPTQAIGKVPCVVIAAAGSPLIWGMKLGEGDRPEHLPYVRAGFAVIAYAIDGPVPEKPTFAQAAEGFRAFRNAHAGVSNTYAAIDYVRANLPQVDTQRIYAVGHSSAGTLALLAAENDPRIRACVAYAPVCDVARHEADLAKEMQPFIPDIGSFLIKTSPITNVAKLRCPLFLFHADDDGTVPKSDNTAFAQKVSLINPQFTFSQVSSGGHYESMLRIGVPRAIDWLKKLN